MSLNYMRQAVNPTVRINVDIENPGQFFACCGLFELAQRQWPGTEACFDMDQQHTFCLFVPEKEAKLSALLDELCHETIEGLTKAEAEERKRLEDSKRRLKKTGEELPPGDEKRRLELGTKAREGSIVLQNFGLTLDWWQHDGTPTTWAGRQEVCRIAQAAQQAIAECLKKLQPQDVLGWPKVLRSPDGSGKKVEPFYFDARRFSHALHEGFSLDLQEAQSVAYPATELLCLVGLQRFRPRPCDNSKQAFQFTVWDKPLTANVAMSVVNGSVMLPGSQRFRFGLRFRDDQKRYKAFGFAKRVGGITW